jgi:hypothetical protein
MSSPTLAKVVHSFSVLLFFVNRACRMLPRSNADAVHFGLHDKFVASSVVCVCRSALTSCKVLLRLYR